MVRIEQKVNQEIAVPGNKNYSSYRMYSNKKGKAGWILELTGCLAETPKSCPSADQKISSPKADQVKGYTHGDEKQIGDCQTGLTISEI